MRYTNLLLLLALACTLSSCQTCTLRSKTDETNPQQTHPQQHHHQQHHKPAPIAKFSPAVIGMPKIVMQNFCHEKTNKSS